MNPNIDVRLIHNQINVKNKPKPKENKQNKTKIKMYDFFVMNEIKISNKIKKIAYYPYNYEIINNYNLVEIGEMSEYVEKLDVVLNTKNNDKYLLIEYNNKKESIQIDFNIFLFHLPSPKLFIFHVLDSYSYLLDSLIKLHSKKICFFDLCPENIIFNEKYKPLLKNFQLSLFVDSLNIEYITKIIGKIINYTHKPLEIHLLFYLIANNEISISYSLIETICKNYIDNMSVLDFFSQNYIELYKKKCEDFLKRYINKQKNEIIQDILSYYDKWDNYSISIIYLHIFGNISRFFSLKDTLIGKITMHLSKNINPDPSKRETLENTQQIYNSLFCEFTDWSFINSISHQKMHNLYEMM